MTRIDEPRAAAEQWTRYLCGLRRVYPLLPDVLRPPASDASIQKLESALGRTLPLEVAVLWKIHDGEREDSLGVIAGFQFLSVEKALSEWQIWADLRATHTLRDLKKLGSLATSLPRSAIQRAYSCEGWLPLWKEPLESNYLGLDLSPGAGGLSGQIINFGRDEDDKVVLASSLVDVLRWLVAEVESNHIVLCEKANQQGKRQPYLAHAKGRFLSILARGARARLTAGK